MERRSQRRDAPTRRSVLALLGGLPVLGCTPIAASKSPRAHDARVVILGGGIAGLNCCHRLADAGIRVDVYEATERAGGRMYSAKGLFAGGEDLVSELGGEFVNSNDAELLSLMSEFGVDSLDLYDDVELSELAWVDGKRITSAALYAAFAPVVDAIDAALATIDSDAVSYENPAGAADIDNQSAAEWLRSVTSDPIALSILSAATTTDYGRDMQDQSALNLLYWFGSDVEAYDERYKVREGGQTIPNQLAARYEDRVHFGKAVVSIQEDSSGVFEVSFADGTSVTADFLVSALPFTVLRALDFEIEMSAVKRRCIDTLGYGSNAKLLLPFQSRYWRDQGDYGAVLTDSGLQAGWDGTELAPGAFGVFANFTGGTHGVESGEGTVSAQAEAALTQLDAFWPGIRGVAGSDPVRQHWPSEPTVLGSYSCYLVGQWTGIGGAEPEAIRRMFFCGEHTSYEFQGYMNGAAESGARAAAEVLAAMDGGAAKQFSSFSAAPRQAPRACRRRGYRRTGRASLPLLASIAALCSLVLLITLARPSRADTPSPMDAEPIATWDGGVMTLSDATSAVAPDLLRLEAEYLMSRYELQSNALNAKLDDMLLTTEAARRHLAGPDALLAIEVNDVGRPPTEAEIAAEYAEQSRRLHGQSLAQVHDQLSTNLIEKRRTERRAALSRGLREQYHVKILLPPPQIPRLTVPTDDDPARGPANAPITIVEFADYQCPYCGKANDTVEAVLAAYPGKVRFVFRDFPLAFHQGARPAAIAANCAIPQGQFWAMHAALFADPKAFTEVDLVAAADHAHLNRMRWNSCRSDAATVAEIDADIRDGTALGVTGTPAFFINGLVLNGAQPFEKFAEIIDRELAGR